MKIGIFLPLAGPTATPDCAATLAVEAEGHGFDSLWFAEHVVLFDEYGSRYPYAADGRIPVGGEAGFLDPVGALCFLAGKTSRIRLGTGICLVPQRNPVYTAKEIATADVLSGGRVDFGVGVGWLAEEFRAVATPFERRGSRTRSYLEVMRRLWCDEVSEFKDEFYELPACRQYPKPVQRPHPPIHFGGESDAALRRVADIGQGWYGFNLEPPELTERLGRLDALLAERGRARSDVLVSLSPYLKGCDEDKLAAYAEAGADQVILTVFATDESSVRRTLEDLAGTLLRAGHPL